MTLILRNIRQANATEFTPNMKVTHVGLDIKEDFTVKGYHKDITTDSKGDFIKIVYLENYDTVTKTGIPKVIEDRTYERDAQTGLMINRITDIYWLEGNAVIAHEKHYKSYPPDKGYKANKKARKNIIETASMWFYSEMLDVAYLGVDPEDPDYVNLLTTALKNATDNVLEFEDLTNKAEGQYIKSNTDKLLDIINSVDDVESENYRAYVTPTMKGTLLAILDISYT